MNTMRNRMVAALLAGVTLASAQVFASALIGSNGQGEEYNDSIPTERLLRQRVASDKDVKVGEWHANLDKCLEYAQKNGVPLIAIWSNGDSCGHCKMFENNALSVPFRNWMAQSGMVFYFGYYGDPGKGATLGEWCTWCGGGNPRGKVLPLFRVYWPAGGVDFTTNGDTPSGYYGKCSLQKETKMDSEPYYVPGDYFTYNMGGRYAAEYFGNLVKNFNPVRYAGGEFGAPDSTTVGLQAELGVTKEVTVPLTRTNATAQATAYNNRLVYTYPGSNPVTITNKIKWVAGQKSTNIVIAISGYTEEVNVGDQIKLKLLNADFKVVEKNQITFVSPVANSAKNPYWIGEKTADTLEFGEWSMDIDVVTSKVKTFNSNGSEERAYAMVLVGGSLWCPDCVMADHWLFDYEIDGVNQFTKWAKERNVALGVVDIPNYTAKGTTSNGSLLTMDMFKMSDNYVSGRGSFNKMESLRYQSGAQYLSRHGITPSAAAKIIDRNKKLVSRDTLNGGYRRPERLTNTYRTGVPLLLVLRDDGTIAGRFDAFGTIGPSAYSTNFLTRLDELLAQVDDPVEEANDDWRTTKETVSKRGTISEKKTLSHTDVSDVYLIEAGAVGKTVNFRISSASSNTVTLSVISSINDMVPLATAKGVAANGLSVTAEINTTDCFLKVEWARNTPETDGSSIFDYTISSDCVLDVSDEVQTATVTDGNPVVTLNTVAGAAYRITNVDETKIAGIFKKGVGDDLYAALSTGGSPVYLKDSTAGQGDSQVYVTEYQTWDSAGVEFIPGTLTMTVENVSGGGLLKVTVRRTDGSDGRIAVKLKTQDASTVNGVSGKSGTDFEYLKEYLVWENGDTEDKIVYVQTYATDSTKVKTLRMKMSVQTTGDYADCGTPTLASGGKVIATINPAKKGKIALVAPDPMATLAGEPLKVTIRRTGGSDGRVAVKFKTQDASTVNGISAFFLQDFDYVKEYLVWEHGDASDRTVEVPTVAGWWTGDPKTFRLKLSVQTTGDYEGCVTPALADGGKVIASILPNEAAYPGEVIVKSVESVRNGETVGDPVTAAMFWGYAGDTLRVTIGRVGGDFGRIAVKVKTQDASTVNGISGFFLRDFDYVKEYLVWEHGDASDRTVEVPTVAAWWDGAPKTFRLKLSVQTTGDYEGCVTPALASGGKVIVSILPNDAAYPGEVVIRSVESVRNGVVVGDPVTVAPFWGYAGDTLRVTVGRVGGNVGRIAVKLKTQDASTVNGITAFFLTDIEYAKEILAWEDGDETDRVLEIPTHHVDGSSYPLNFRLKFSAQTTGAYADCVTPELPVPKVIVSLQQE